MEERYNFRRKILSSQRISSRSHHKCLKILPTAGWWMFQVTDLILWLESSVTIHKWIKPNWLDKETENYRLQSNKKNLNRQVGQIATLRLRVVSSAIYQCHHITQRSKTLLLQRLQCKWKQKSIKMQLRKKSNSLKLFNLSEKKLKVCLKKVKSMISDNSVRTHNSTKSCLINSSK